jgi:N utilization substance protein B
MSRKKIREEIFKLVFEGEIRNENLLNILNDFLKRNTEISDENDLNFIKKYLIGINDKSLLIHKQIDDNMTGWVFERIGFVERAIFKCSVYELIEKEIPVEIIVNEAVELAKKYGDEKTSDFINGVLANIIN